MKGFVFCSLCLGPYFFAQQSAQDSIKTNEISEVKILKKFPVTQEIIQVKKELEGKNLGQDLPILLKNQTSIETSSDAGNGIGYTAMRIRGVDGTRINVMLNGVPYNDSESQGTFFVNLPDISSSASTIVIQRGVGSSTNGVASFGGSVNVITQNPSEKAYFAIQNSYGSFQSHKNSFEGGTGKLLNGKLTLMGRYSIIKSDGYIDRAFSDLQSYIVTALYQTKNTKLRLMTFGGKEKTYQAWNGISKEQYEKNPTYNSSGEIYNTQGDIIGYYDNETDNYKQQHYHLLWEEKLSNRWKLNTTVYFTKGEGFYDNYKSNQKLSKYGLENISIGGTNINRMDLIRQKWLDNKFYGVVSDLQGNVSQWNFNFGWIANQYYGEHFGKITHGAYLQPNLLPMEYYRNHSLKNEWSAYAKALYKLNQFEFFGDVQTRNIHYQTMVDKASPEENPDFDKNYSFMNPKVGANFLLENAKIYFSYANAHREPTRSDLVANSSVKSEQLHDFELGYTHRLERFFMTANLFYMQYQNQLVLTGALNEVGAALHENVGSSFRRGLEIASQYKISQRWNLSANATFSQNKNLDYILNNELGFAHLGTTDIAFSPSYIGNLSINYQPNTHFSFTISNKWVSKQYINNTQTTEFELKPFQLSDFMASYQTLWKNTELSFFLLVNNFLNKPYTNYGADYGSPYYFAQARANFILGFNLKFD